MKQTLKDEIEIYKRALKREKAARKAAEEILEQKSTELFDITQELKKANSKLQKTVKEQNTELQGVFENIIDAYIVMDLWGNVLKMNEAAISLLGYNHSNNDFNLFAIADKDEIDNVMSTFEVLMSEGSVTDFKVKLNTKSGKQIIAQVNASVILDENNKAIAAQGIIRDVTYENKYRQAIEAEKQKYSRIIANMHLGLVELDKDEKIMMANQSFCKMTGFTEEELIGIVAKEILPAEEDKDLVHEKTIERKSGKSNAYEARVKMKNGDLRYWLISGAPNYDLNGNIIGSIGISFDITDLKNLQLQKEGLLKTLETRNNELHEYAHIVSHDLKSPLRSINALVSWLKEDNKSILDEVSMQNFAHIETTLEKMEQLITDILAYSSAGSEDKEKADVDLDVLVNDLVKILYVPEHVEVVIPHKLPVVKGDQTKLQQLFQNLISNAVKFIDKPEGLIRIKVKELPSYYEFSVSDNGIGIDKKYHDKIFKIFHSLKKSKDSTGIGLSIVKKIVDLHEGEIWLDSQVDLGTTFYFTIKK
ncbi:PAS domain S-box protein [Winogradskyella eckloniae]|uniref:PAS domain-containing sensor histidine kinase n=1 Tax=Winogradskyella eckloniae TaxID=1089306 RepID=UPI001566432E|nr:PAS domain-containing sensor histidine kinase [Winogradskyella eckloniae]NRD19199.1 PAS domain S-box protein [Winogradskyella eckloniae]